MGDTKIDWTDKVWNPIRGCTRMSPGCGGPGPHGGCYAEAMAARFSDPGMWGYGFAEHTPAGGRWTGKVSIQWDRLELPLRWKAPAKISASSTSDWFHELLPPEEIATLFAVAVAAVHLRGHTFQILTKRAARMREIMNSEAFWDQVNAEAGAHVMEGTDPLDRRSDDARATLDDYGPDNPPPGIWMGTSVEDQVRADERIPLLLDTPAAVRFLSCEPLLGPIDLTNVAPPDNGYGGKAHGVDVLSPYNRRLRPCIDWVIVGGESGPKARPMHPEWPRSLRDQCGGAGVPFFFKQWGENLPAELEPPGRDNEPWRLTMNGNRFWSLSEYGKPRDQLEPVTWSRVGKAKAGAMLDGREWREFPR